MKANQVLNKLKSLREENRTADAKTWAAYPSKDEYDVAWNDMLLDESHFHTKMTKIIREFCDENFLDLPPDDLWTRNNIDGKRYLSHSGVNLAAQNILSFSKSEKEFNRQGWIVWTSVISGIGGFFGAVIGSGVLSYLTN